MKVNGSCHCGAIRFEAEIDPSKVHVCHCTDCQKLSGSAYRVVSRAPYDSFRVLSGQPKKYVKQADSGRNMIQAFCPDCGTPIYGAHETDPTFCGIRVTTLDQRLQLKPSLQIWCESTLDWAEHLYMVPRIGEHI